MKIYNTFEELQKDVVYNLLNVDDDITINFNLNFPGLDIKAWNINAVDINVVDINAVDIIAGDIIAGDINYYAVCCAYNNITCKSITGDRNNARHFCLDGKITITCGT